MRRTAFMTDTLRTLAALALIVACGRGDDASPARTPSGPPTPDYPGYIDAGDVAITRDMLARGDSVFHGRGVASICVGCHAREGAGSDVVRPLSDNAWAYTDGSFAGIREVTHAGLPDAAVPMPPMGGATLSPEDLDAVTAYVYWISRRDGREPRRIEAAPGG
jgi:mono/diheme cytochrome c family protein